MQILFNIIKQQVENCHVLPRRNLISTCNRWVKSVSAGRIKFHPGKPGSCNHHLRQHLLKKKISKYFDLQSLRAKASSSSLDMLISSSVAASIKTILNPYRYIFKLNVQIFQYVYL